MQLGCEAVTLSTKSCRDIEDICERARNEGFNTIELSLLEGEKAIDPSKVYVNKKYWINRIKSALEKFELSVCAINAKFSVQLTTSNQEDYSLFKKHYKAVLELAEAVHCPVVILHPGSKQPNMATYECRSVLAEHLHALGKQAAKRKINICVESEKDSIIENPEEALRIIQEVYPLVGSCYNPSHFAMQGISLYKTRALLDYAYHVHIRNAAPYELQSTVDNGKVDFKWMYDVLKENDYQGCLSIEYINQYDKQLTETRKIVNLYKESGVLQ